MPKTRIFLLIIFLLVPSFIFAQTSRSVSTAANKSWQQFWVRFNQAVKKKDRIALRKMMSDDFDDNGGGSPADDYVIFELNSEVCNFFVAVHFYTTDKTGSKLGYMREIKQ